MWKNGFTKEFLPIHTFPSKTFNHSVKNLTGFYKHNSIKENKMHIPNEMLSTPICPVTAAVALAGLGLCAYTAWRAKGETKKLFTPSRFAMASSLVFALQMLNFPLAQGISGHFVGGVLAAAILGVPGGVLCMALVLGIQALFFADGGTMTLGANILNMGLLGAGFGGLLRNFFVKKGMNAAAATGISAAAAMEAAALAMVAELAFSGKATLEITGMLMGTHTILALAEAVITCVLVKAVAAESEKRFLLNAALLTVVALLISPFACSMPDALEATLARFSVCALGESTYTLFTAAAACAVLMAVSFAAKRFAVNK